VTASALPDHRNQAPATISDLVIELLGHYLVDKLLANRSIVATGYCLPLPTLVGVSKEASLTMASASPVVLLVGYQCKLLLARSEILTSFGFVTIRAQTLSETVEFMEVLGQTRCDLVVICHSFSPSDRNQLIAHLLSNYPWVRFLTLMPGDDNRRERFLERLEDELGIDGPLQDGSSRFCADK